MPRIPLLILLAILSTSAGCISHRAVSARRAIVESARADADSARSEFVAVAVMDLRTHGALALREADAQFSKAIAEQHAAGNASPERIEGWSRMYSAERDRIRAELMKRAEGLTAILRKIESGGEAVAALERMEVAAEDARRQFILGYKPAEPSAPPEPNAAIDPALQAAIDSLMAIKIERPEPADTVGPPAPGVQ